MEEAVDRAKILPFLDDWQNLIKDTTLYSVSSILTTLADITAAEYQASNRLDLDHLTSSTGNTPLGTSSPPQAAKAKAAPVK